MHIHKEQEVTIKILEVGCVCQRHRRSRSLHAIDRPSGGLSTRGVAKYSDFGPIEGYILETR